MFRQLVRMCACPCRRESVYVCDRVCVRVCVWCAFFLWVCASGYRCECECLCECECECERASA